MVKSRERNLIIVAAFIYLATIITISRGLVVVSIIGFVTESLLLIGLAMMISTEEKETTPEGEVDQEMLLALEQEKLLQQQRIDALNKEIEDMTEEMKKLNLSVEAESKTLQAKYEHMISQNTKDNAEVFLPPIEADEEENETIDIIKIASDTIEELDNFAKDAGLNIIISTSDESLLVKGNVSRMRILFRNIIDNSIKYMNKSGNLIITISNIGDDIFIVLKDNGNGLSEDETKHIFELNYQGSNRISGNGLGLTQAKAIVDYYGGTIYAKSNIGRGMGIYIQLPTT